MPCSGDREPGGKVQWTVHRRKRGRPVGPSRTFRPAGGGQLSSALVGASPQRAAVSLDHSEPVSVCQDWAVPPGRQAGRQSPRREAVALTHGYLPGNTALRMTCSTSCVYHRLFHLRNNPLQIKNGLCNRPLPEIAQVRCVLDGPPYPFTTVLLL